MTGREALGTVGETALTPLYAKAHAAELVPDASFADPLAASVLERIGYDDSRVLTDRSNVAGAVYRSAAIDEATVRFAQRHPTGHVVSVGIGLCTRHGRLADRVPDTVGWVGVDTADVIDTRSSYMPDDPVELVTASIAEPGWADPIDADRPTIVIAEGLLMYLDPAGLAALLTTVRDRFGPGTQLIGDYFHPKVALSGRHPIVRKTGAQFRSGARNGQALAATVAGYRLVDEYPVMERIGYGQHAAAKVFTLLSRGGRAYAVAHLEVTEDRAGD